MEKVNLDDMDLEELRHFHSSPELEAKLKELATASCKDNEAPAQGPGRKPCKPPIPSLG